MAVDIIHDTKHEVACMYDTTSDHAFGPIFTGPTAGDDAGAFLEWLRENGATITRQLPGLDRAIWADGKDPRDWRESSLVRIIHHWQDTRAVEA